MLAAFNDILVDSINSLGICSSEELARYGMTRTLTPIKTIKGISEDILEIDRTTVIKNLQKLSEDEYCLYNQLSNLTDILDDDRYKFVAIVDSMLVRRWSDKVYGCTIRYNYIERHYKPYQEVINCSIYHEKKGYMRFTLQ
ncbi:hypothetical protein ACO3VM_06810 [Methanocaldococcus sp. 10A]